MRAYIVVCLIIKTLLTRKETKIRGLCRNRDIISRIRTQTLHFCRRQIVLYTVSLFINKPLLIQMKAGA